jgi:hypothetical protein
MFLTLYFNYLWYLAISQTFITNFDIKNHHHFFNQLIIVATENYDHISIANPLARSLGQVKLDPDK